MPWKSRKQLGWAYANKVSFRKRWSKETFKGVKGGKANKRRFARLPTRVRKKKK